MISDIEDYFAKGCGRCARFATDDCSTRRWQRGLADLRRICRDMGLLETVKWGHPCFVHADRNIAILGAFRGDFRISFMNAALMTDPAGVLERPGPNTRHPSMIRFTDTGDVAEREAVIRSYLADAMRHAEAGTRAPKAPAEIALPAELVAALDADPELAEAFQSLTPGRQRSYAIALGAAKKTETRIARIAKLRDRIIAGKGATER
ncbi:MAG: YdeI/OmpD-associated family protein [Sedimentitalea sp.]|nr:YdeI/OmpD-associated family protein [Sedimentitalea sp.]